MYQSKLINVVITAIDIYFWLHPKIEHFGLKPLTG